MLCKTDEQTVVIVLRAFARPSEDKGGSARAVCQSPVRNQSQQPGQPLRPCGLSPAALQSLQAFPSHHLKPTYFLDQALPILGWASLSISRAPLGGGACHQA